MQLKLLFLISFCIHFSQFSYGQYNYRIKKIKVENDSGKIIYTSEFLLPPHSKIVREGFIFPNKSLVFKPNSKFQYQYVLIKDLKSQYDSSRESIAKAIYKRYGSELPKKIRELYKIPEGFQELSLGSFVKYFVSEDNMNIIFQIDYDALLADKKNFKKYYLELFKELSTLEDKNKWGGFNGSIVQNIVEKIFELTPCPQSESLGRYMAIYGNEVPPIAFAILNPKIWLSVDNVDRVRPKFPDNEKKGNITTNLDFWSFNLNGKTIIKFYRDTSGLLIQNAFLTHSINNIQPANKLNIDSSHNNGTLQASSIDIQFNNVLKKQKYIYYYFPSIFKENNADATPVSPTQKERNNFIEQNGLLLFNDHITASFISSINTLNPDPLSNTANKFSVFGLRNSITIVIPVSINNVVTPIDLGSTLDIIKQFGNFADIKKTYVHRIYKNSYRKIKFLKDDLLLLPSDEIK